MVENKYITALTLVLVVLCIFFIYNYDVYLFLRPQSVHFWRQTDSLSFISGYFKSGNGLFSPSVLNLQGGNGNSASEFPLFYYLISQVDFLYQNKETVLRVIYLLVYFTGLISLYKLYSIFKLPWIFKVCFILLITSSCVLSYYACNVVPDSCCFGLTLSGVYFYFLNRQQSSKMCRLLYVALFALAASMKVQYLIYPIALIGSEFFSGAIRDIPFSKRLLSLVKNPLNVVILICAAWYCYVVNYNDINCSTCFLTTMMPIWNLSYPQIADVWNSFTGPWYSSYYYPTTFHLFFIITALCLMFFRRINKFVRAMLLLIFAGNLVYFLLFYYQFNYHDYYFICFIPFIAFLPIAFNDIYQVYKEKVNVWFTWLLQFSLLIITVLSVNYGRDKLQRRYKIVEDAIETVNKDFYTLDVYLDSINISRDALVLSYPDFTCNATLYFIDRRGWTLTKDNFPEAIIQGYVNRGAQYLIVNGNYSEFNYLSGKQVGQHGNIRIFAL